MDPRRLSSGDEEEIVVKPSTELIADEYEHSLTSTKNIEVHVFATKLASDQENADLFIATLNKNNYQVRPEHTHCLDKDDFYQVLGKIINESNDIKSPPDGLILYFSGFCNQKNREGAIDVFNGESNITISVQDIWSKFTTEKCPQLKNKPKIFIFHITTVAKKIEIDGKRHMFATYNMVYETPAEADIVVVYHKTDPNYQLEFTEQLCDNINQYGKNEDIISLVTCIDSNLFNTRPVIISTLTRKFYFTASDYRGLHLDIDESHKELKKHVKELEEKLSQVNIKPEKKKSRFSFNIGKKRSEKREKSIEVADGGEINKSNSPKNGIRGNSPPRSRISSLREVKTHNRKSSKTESDGDRPKWTLSFLKN